ncbi:S locus-related glycoprotein 1 binding pollen coat protein [Arabidopsis suecica]|uniref:S locus-related glycoprotein 1 binding pollen coat protein n=1 Tax=Arabidopsis suecica TaxID=45249 RepID=A0A8T2EKF5_ARASU|nr:S locus-related glycoprotein 1 binding pollen coat protein [Arabidopsis suecica]
MAKLSCSYFLVLILVLSAFLMVERAEGKRCHLTIDKATACSLSDCRLSCYSGYNGVGKCFDDPKVAGPSNCGCIYNC